MATTRTFPEDGLIKTTDLKYPITIDVTNRFAENLKKLTELIGITRKTSVTEGTTLRIYGGYDVTLAEGAVPEGEIIPLSKVARKEHTTKVISLKKYRKAATAEDIQMYGEDEAVANTDDALLRRLQKDIRTELVAELKKGTGTEVALANGLQGAVATAWGKLQVLFEDYDVEKAIVFVNHMDLAEHVAKAGLTLQNAFGITYVQDFTGTILIGTNDVEKGQTWATVPENLNLAFINPNTSQVAKAFGLSGDSLGYIGMTHFAEPTTATIQTLVMSGILIYPERVDGIVKVNIVPGV